ncbi:MAG: H-NS histone family protein [Pseudomonadota bacterium]|nr:H-NS histone family protein [Pseudomonadota bacterium]MDQ3160995.1 H-NS histone family protein [Pseudomonadota bacterium]
MSMNIENLSTKELAELIARASKRKKVLAKRRPATQVKAAVAKFLKSTGWDFEELYGQARPSKPAAAAETAASPAAPKARKSTKGRTLGKVAPKYRNPANPKETWAGRGKQPRWMSAETSKGRKLEDFLIK